MALKEFFLNRINLEKFEYVNSIPTTQKDVLRKIFYDSINNSNLNEQTALDENIINSISNKIVFCFGLKDWQAKRLAKTEFSKLRTLSFIDMLNSESVYTCRVSSGSDSFDACINLIDGKVLDTKILLDNVYKNYGLKTPQYPAVPLHPNCNHYIMRP